MKITISFDDGKIVELPSENEIVHTINAKYPEMGMMVAMEELDELAIALSKGVRNGNKDKLDKWFKFALENGFIEDYDERMNVTEDFYCSGEKYDEFIKNIIKSENIDKMIEDIKKNIVVS